MANEKYYTIVTKRGLEKIQDYYRQEKTLPLTMIGFGGLDGSDEAYVRPAIDMTQVPNEWAKIAIERKPKEGFIGGGGTVNNKTEAYRGKWIRNAGIYDEDGELILVTSTTPNEVTGDESVVSSHIVDVYTVLENASHVVVVTDTSLAHPTYDEMNEALEALQNKLSQYATTEVPGLIELATPQEVDVGDDAARAVTPATLKPVLDAIKSLISNTENDLSQAATTERLGLTELATQQEVDNRSGANRVVTAQTLDKPGLISFLQRYADGEVEKLKQLIFGGNPSAALDTLFELANAYENADDAIQAILNDLSTKLPKATYDSFVSSYNQFKLQIQAQVDRKWEAVDGTTSRKGIVQLSSAVNSTSASHAATPSAVKQAYDLASGKWTASDASTSKKGIVQLSTAVNSTSTTLAATPSAVKQAYDYAASVDSSVVELREEVAQKTRWVKRTEGKIDYLLANQGLTKRGTVTVNWGPPAWQHRSGRFMVKLITSGQVETNQSSTCWWTAIAKDIREITKWTGTGRIEFDVYTAAGGIYNTGRHTGKVSGWELWELIP